MAYATNITHIFVDAEGNQIDVLIGQPYQVISTTFLAGSTSDHGFSSQQLINHGTFYHHIAPRLTIQEEPELY